MRRLHGSKNSDRGLNGSKERQGERLKSASSSGLRRAASSNTLAGGKNVSRSSSIAASIIDNKYVVGFTTALTICALTGDDVRLMATTASFDQYYNVMILFVFLVFGAECALSCIGKEDYFLGFFFWLDLISTLTLLLDITFVLPLLTRLFSGEEDNAGGEASSARAGRSAKIGAKAGRVVRVLRLVRILKLYKAYYEAKMKKKREEERLARGTPGDEDDWADEDDDNVEDQDNVSESRVGKKLSETTTRRVICLILAMLLVLPILQVEMTPASSAEYGADYVMWSFMYYIAGNVSKVEYEKAMLQYSYYHNWFAREEQFCPRGSCADINYANLFWIGVTGTNLTAVREKSSLARLDFESIATFNRDASDQDFIYNYGTMPQQALTILSSPWDVSCDKDGTTHQYGLGLSLLADEIDGIVSQAVRCPSDLRSAEVDSFSPRTMTSADGKQWNFQFSFDLRKYTMEVSLFSILTTAFVLVLLILGSMMFSNDAKRLVVTPVEKMIQRVEAIRENPLIAIKMADEEFKAEEIAKAKNSRRSKDRAQVLAQEFLSCSMFCGKGGNVPMETVILEKTIIKLGSLLALGFGEAGANIIGQNMSGSDTAGVNAMIPGTHVDCVIGVVRVKNFSTATEVLQAKIMTFVNQVAEIVHGVVNDFHGAPNKNNGDAFLIIWRVDDRHLKKNNEMEHCATTRHVEFSVVAFSTILGALQRSPLLATYRQHPGLQFRLGTDSRVNLSFGLHYGWAIEGAVGSEFKIDPSYLSPNVSIALSVERATEIYNVSLLVAQSVIEMCSSQMRSKCRLIDHVILRGSSEAMALYCLDLDYRSVKVDSDEPLGIVWNSRNRYLARQFLESEKNSKLAAEYDPVASFDTDVTLTQMRRRYTVDFFELFKMGYQNYYEGEWGVARRMLTRTRDLLDIEDGPSCALLKFMEGHDFEAPRGWKGVREVDTKQAGQTS